MKIIDSEIFWTCDCGFNNISSTWGFAFYLSCKNCSQVYYVESKIEKIK